MAGESQQQLHVVLFPVMAHGHMLPILDIAKLFAARGVKVTIITTPHNVPVCAKAIKGSKQVGPPMIHIEVFQFPSAENGLPEGCEILQEAIKLWLLPNFMKAINMLREQLEQYLDKARPDCLVSDMFLPWTTDIAAKFNIPRMVFHGTCCFARCATEIVEQHKPFSTVSSDDEPFVIPFLPHEIQFTRLQIADYFLRKEEVTENESHQKVTTDIKESEIKSFGVIFNSFYELEPENADFYTKELGRRAWLIGPVSLCNRSVEDKAQRGEDNASANEDECLKWLHLKNQDSVLYICSGSITHFSASQLYEISMALEASEQEFIWVVKKEEELPPGFEQRTEGKGLILRGWAPQLLILEQEAIGAFLTHCGWNSILEGISAGVPMVTWPIFGEQFYNEKLVTEILKIGVPVGVKKWSFVPQTADLIKKDMIERALHEVMKGEEAQERRNRAKKLKEMAHKAVEESGSSYSDLGALINELRHYHATP